MGADDKTQIKDKGDGSSDQRTAGDKLREEASQEQRSIASRTQTLNNGNDNGRNNKPDAIPKETDRGLDSAVGSNKQTDLQVLQQNWKKLVEGNSKLTDKQKEDLTTSLEVLEKTNTSKVSDFRKLVTEVGRLGTANGADTQVRVDALAKIANTVANYSDAVHLPIERVIGARNTDSLKQVAESFAQSAPHETVPPEEVDGTPTKTGDGYEHAASKALQLALQDKAAMDKLVESGKLPPGDWVFVPAAKGSVADDLKIDGMLVDMKSGKAVFLDFAMHQTGRTPYSRLIDKLNTNDKKNTYKDGSLKHPWALTLDNDTIGWDPKTGKPSGSIDSTRILERVGAYMNGKQTQELGFTNITQSAPAQYDIAKLRADLGGRFPNFGIVNGKFEAASQSRETGDRVLTRQDELAEIADKTRGQSNPAIKIFKNAAESAANAAEEVASGSDFFNEGMRAAVEAEKYGGRDKIYGPSSKVPDVNLKTGQDYGGVPSKYSGKQYIGITGDDTKTSRGADRIPSEVRIYENGDVLVKPGGGDFHAIGNVRDLGKKLAESMQRDGIDPKTFKAQIEGLSRVSKNLPAISKDIDAVNAGSMTAEKFWLNHPELRLLADGAGHKEATQRAAQESRRVYDARQNLEKNQEFAGLPEKTKAAIAEKSVDLDKAGYKKLSLQDVRTVLQLEDAGMKTVDAVDASRFKTAVGKDASGWNANELKRNFEGAKQAQTRDYPAVKDLPDVYRLQQIQTQMRVDTSTAQTLFKFKKLLPEATNDDLAKAKQLYDSAKAAGVRSFGIESAANAYARYGNLTQPVIDEMGRLSNIHKGGLKPEDIAGLAVRNLQVEVQYGVSGAQADRIRSQVSDLAKAGVPPEQLHDAAALMILKNMNQNDAVAMSKTMSELRQRQSFSGFAQLADTANVLQTTGKLSNDNIRSEFQQLIAEGVAKHGNDVSKLRDFIEEEVFHRATGGGANEKDWSKLFENFENAKSNEDFTTTLGLPSDPAAQKAALESYQKLFKPAAQSDSPTQPGQTGDQTSVAQVQAQLQGTPTFIKLTDEARMKDALNQFTDRAQRMPAGSAERANFLTKQLKATMRKQLGVATDAELPEALRNMQIKVVDGDAKAPKVVQASAKDPAVIEIPAKLLEANPRGALVDVYANASALSMIDMLHEKGNHAVTMQSLKPMLNKIAGQAEKIVGARSAALANQEKPVVTADAAASDRPIKLDPKNPLVTAWDGENLTFGGEKFQVKSEVEKLERERGDRVKDLDERYRKAKELAESTKKTEDVAKAQALETQLAAERQNLRVVSELKLAMNGQRGQAAQEKALSLVKTAADRAIEERFNPKETGGAPVSRAAAMAMVLSTLAFMYFGANGPAQAATYEGSFR